MRFTSSAAAAALALTTVSNVADALDLFTQESPWELLADMAHRRNDNLADENSEQVFMRCSQCVTLAASFASGEDTLTLPLPHHDGTISRFTLKRTTDDVIAKELQAQFPDAQTYYGRNNKGVTVEIDSTVAGGVRVQYHGAHGELSYLDHVRSDDPDLPTAPDTVQGAVANNNLVFRVYRRVAGQRASEVLASPEFKCSTNSTDTLKAPKELLESSSSVRRLQAECPKPTWNTDSYCDPINNIAACGYDGGDCCGRSVDKQYCTEDGGGGPNSEACSCLDPSFSSEPDANGCILAYSGDGICDAGNNKGVCGNDGEDCCGVFSDQSLCEDGDDCGCPDDAQFASFPGHTYRIAVGTSKGYSAFHGDTIETVLAEVLTAVNRIGGIYKRTLNIGLQLFGNTTQLFELSTTDPAYFDEQGDAIANATPIFKNKLGGSVDGFDVGHYFFSTGNSYITGRACSSIKANGGSGSSRPVADGYYVDFLAHEIGHQFAGGHTWSGESCAAGQFVQGSGVEPGSGATIMAYAGICGSDNVQSASDPYFSLISLEQIHGFALANFNGDSCGIAAPEVIAPKLAPKLGFPLGKCQIPLNTSFVLAPQVGDILLSAKEGARLSYSWEQADLATEAVPIGVYEFGPIFRSQVPIEQPVRYFPSPASLISGETIPGEPLLWTKREFRFSLTVRDTWQLESDVLDAQVDLNSGRGSYAAEFVKVSVADVGPFEIDAAEAALNGHTVKVSWNTQTVASLVINAGAASNTKVSLSYDNGATFSIPSSFKFSDGEATVQVEGCAIGDANHNEVAVLVEVESVTGCSFYAAKSVGQVACRIGTPEPTVSSSKPTKSPTDGPTKTPTKTVTNAPSSNSTTFTPTPELPADIEFPTLTPTTTEAAGDNTTIFIIGGAAGGLILILAAIVITRHTAKPKAAVDTEWANQLQGPAGAHAGGLGYKSEILL